MQKRSLLFFCFVLSLCSFSQKKDSLTVTLAQAEEIFLKKNYLLLSTRYQVEAIKANEIQEKLYNNPVLSAEIAGYGENKKWFDAGKNGQKSFGVDQLIILAGKRNKRVQLAKEQTNEALLSFYELVRTLKYELRQNFYTVAFASELVKQYDEQVRFLQQIIRSYDQQTDKRNVSLKDAVRLKTELIQLSADRNAVILESISAMQALQLIMDTTAHIIPVNEKFDKKEIPAYEYLIEKAKQNRSDLKIEESQLKQEQLNYILQKSMAKPDITIGAGYDQSGGYVNNLYSFRSSMELPFFNWNQGNIKAAKSLIRSAELRKDFKHSEIEKELLASIARLQEAEKEFAETNQNFNNNFPAVNLSVIENFNRGNISILEFLDFFENYNSAIRQVNQFQKQRQLAWEGLEYTVGTKLTN